MQTEELNNARRVHEMVVFFRSGRPNCDWQGCVGHFLSVLFELGTVRNRRGCQIHNQPFTVKTVWVMNDGIRPSMSSSYLRARSVFFPNAFPHFFGRLYTEKPHSGFRKQAVHYCEACTTNSHLFGYYFSLVPYLVEKSDFVDISVNFMKDTMSPWVLFEHGTIVSLPVVSGDLAEQATALLQEQGVFDDRVPAHLFEVATLAGDQGWAVQEPYSSLKNMVLRLDDEARDDIILRALLRRDQDAFRPVVIHIASQMVQPMTSDTPPPLSPKGSEARRDVGRGAGGEGKEELT